MAPQGGFVWTDPSDPTFSRRHTSLRVLLDLVHERLMATGGFVGDGWEAMAIDRICQHGNVPCEDRDKPKPRERTLADLIQFGNVAKRYIDTGGELVPQEEAERRATICLQCPMHKPISGFCLTCKAADIVSWLWRAKQDRATSVDGSLMACGVCGCDLKLSVHIPLEVQRDDRFTPQDFPGSCWKRPANSS
jgi:hypothetical protein